MLSRIKSPLIAALVVAGTMATAQAEGMYAGVGVGAPDYSSSINGLGGGGGGSGPSLNVYGGYKLTPNVAAEGGWFSFGQTGDVNGNATTNGLYVDALGTLPLTPQWSVLGSAGVAQANFSTGQGNDTSPGWKLGTGVQYQLTPTAALRVKYDRYMFVNAFGNRPNVGEVSAGLNFGF